MQDPVDPHDNLARSLSESCLRRIHAALREATLKILHDLDSDGAVAELFLVPLK